MGGGAEVEVVWWWRIGRVKLGLMVVVVVARGGGDWKFVRVGEVRKELK